MPASFIHLRVHSTYSLLEGALRFAEITDACKRMKMPAIAVTDTGNLFGALEFAGYAAKAGIQPIHGAIVKLQPPSDEIGMSGKPAEPDELLLLVQNETGWRNLLHIVSDGFLRPANDTPPLISYEQLDGRTEGLICLSGGCKGRVAKLLAVGAQTAAEVELLRQAEWFPGRYYIELQRHELLEEEKIEDALVDLAVKHHLPLVATNDAYFLEERQHGAHDALLCISEGRYVSEANRRKVTPHHHLKSPEAMTALFEDIPEAIENTVNIARRCAFQAPSRAPFLPRFSDSDAAESALLREAAERGLQERLRDHVYTPEMDDAKREELRSFYHDRLQFEVDVIEKMGFAGYFLIVSDFIQWSKNNDIPVGPGRGSGAGSLAAWCLRITDLDPIRYGLLFERFLNPDRVSMPDFDVDFCQDRRDEVIAYVQQRYGHSQVAQIITFGKLQARAVLRDVGRVLQLPYGQVDRICKLVPNNPANPVTLAQAIQMEPELRVQMRREEPVKRMVETALELEGLNRHASTHAAGVVIADRPLVELLPMYRDPKSGGLVVQYSMKYAEQAGLVKFDFLGLKTLSVLKRACDMVRENGGPELDLLQLPEGDSETYALLGRGEATGIFQLESAGMRDTLRKLRPDCIEDIIALVSLYRPGPMENIPTYIARKHGYEKPAYLHPQLESILKETFGVIIYQEQVMQIARDLAGYSLAEADLLRRAMGKKIKEEMEAQRDIFTSRAIENGIDAYTAREIFNLMEKFASYGFNKSHAAAYALIAYQTAYLKANWTAEFLAASMCYDMHNTDKLGAFREEAARMGIALLPPDVNRSQASFSVETLPDGKKAIRYGLAALKNVGAQAMEALVAERDANGPFRDIFDMGSRLDARIMNRRQLEHLVKAGVFDGLNPNRAQLYGALDMVLGYSAAMQRDRDSNQDNLFGDASAYVPVPVLRPCEDWPLMARLQEEYGAVGFFLSAHPVEGYRTQLGRIGAVPIMQLARRLNDSYQGVSIAGIVIGKKIKVSDRGKFAFISLSDETGVCEVSIFEESLLIAHEKLLDVGQLVHAQCDGKSEEGGVRMIVRRLQPVEDAIRAAPQRLQGLSVRIELQDSAALSRIQNILPPGNGRGVPVSLSVRLAGGQQAEIALPNRYDLMPPHLQEMAAIPGVLSVREVDTRKSHAG